MTKPQNAGVVGRAAGAEILAAREAAEGVQVELFDLPVADPSGKIAAARDALVGPRGRGRPAGAVSRGPKALREYLLARGANPLEQLMKFMMMGPVGIAELTRAQTPKERLLAFKEWRTLTADLSTFFAPRMVPQDQDGRAVPYIVMQIGNAGGAMVHGPGGEEPPWAKLLDEQNQQLMSEATDESQKGESQE